MARQTMLRTFTLGSFALLLVTAAANAESDPEDVIKYRQNVMKANGAHAAAAGAIIQGKVGYKKTSRITPRPSPPSTVTSPRCFPRVRTSATPTRSMAYGPSAPTSRSAPRMHGPSPTPSPRPWPRATQRGMDRSSRNWWIPARPVIRTTARKRSNRAASPWQRRARLYCRRDVARGLRNSCPGGGDTARSRRLSVPRRRLRRLSHRREKPRPRARRWAGDQTPRGTFYGPNISPDPAHGLGRWRKVDFIRAMREGVRPDGAHYYPSFPYASYTRLSDDDLRALWAYLRRQPPVAQPNRPHDLPWYLRPRSLLSTWKALYFTPGAWQPRPDKDETWNRGAYLVEAVTHCGECHTPRDAPRRAAACAASRRHARRAGRFRRAQYHAGPENRHRPLAQKRDRRISRQRHDTGG